MARKRGWASIASRWARVAVVVGSLALAGCQQELYSNLSEVEANQMMTALMVNGIAVEKVSKGKEVFAIAVDDHNIRAAMGALNDAGYPRKKAQTLTDVFPPGGLVTTDFEQRVRYIHLREEKVAQAISTIDGVILAQVLLVLPDPPPLGQPVKPSSASVLIKHQPGVDLGFMVPQIKRLVSNSVDNLEYTAVNVMLTDAIPTKATAAGTADESKTHEVLPGLSINDASSDRFWQIVGLVGIIMALLVASNIAMLATKLRRWHRKRPATEGALVAVEPS